MIKIHHPPHLFINNQYYFITARIYCKQKIFNNDKKKTLLQNSLKAEFQSGGYELMAWVVLSNHYYILFKVRHAKSISNRINYLHGRTSYLINKMENKKGRQIFQNYWDYCIRNEVDYWKHFNYIHHNPIKHGLTKNLKSYQFSSYDYWIAKKGTEWMNLCFANYPIVDFTI
ncbi:MAG: REP-associated tyrosine transposase [Candidatus Kerfeldbacteria bacterium]|jgi:REP-associated tyrosine transposase